MGMLKILYNEFSEQFGALQAPRKWIETKQERFQGQVRPSAGGNVSFCPQLDLPGGSLRALCHSF